MGPSEPELAIARIRLLSAIELAAADMLLPVVTHASEDLKITWKAIGEAAGLTDSAAHRKWADVTKGLRAVPKRHERSNAKALRELTSTDLGLMKQVLDELQVMLKTPTPYRPWADAVRRSLSKRRVAHLDQARDRVTAFTLPDLDLQIGITEPDDGEDPTIRLTVRRLFNNDLLCDESIAITPDRPSAQLSLERQLGAYLDRTEP